MIQITDDLLFAEGGRRFCFVHPDDATKCIKTLSPNGDPRKRKKEAVWYKKLRPLSMFDDNQRELKSFLELERYGDVVWNHFPRCYGIQETSCGPGIVTDLIRDADGSISKTIRQHVKEYGKTRKLLSSLDVFFDLLRTHRIITRDVLDHNLVVRNEEGRLTVFMIDGFGSVEIIPFSQWLPKAGERKVGRKISRFYNRYQINSTS